MRKNSKIFKLLLRLDEFFAVSMLSALCIIIVVSVVFRYVLNNPLGWTEEISRLLHIWMIFIGAAVVAKKDGHLRVQILLNYLSPKWKKYFYFLSEIGSIIFWLIVLWQGIRFIIQMGNERSTVTEYPMFLFHAVAPVAAILLSTYSFLNLLKLLNSGKLKT